MVRALLQALRTGDSSANARTAAVLRARGLLRPDGSLSDEGFAKAVEYAPLDEQCRKLSLPLRFLEVSTGEKPEITALQTARRAGWRGTACEGRAALSLLKAGMLDFLREHSPLGADDATSRFIEAQIVSYQQRHKGEPGSDLAPRDALSGPIDYTRWEQALSQILRTRSMQGSCPELSSGLGMEIVRAVGPDRWFRVAEALCRDPYGFRSGWPDLFLVNDARDLLAVEVKVLDRLHASQIRTIPVLRDEVGIPVEVWQLAAVA